MSAATITRAADESHDSYGHDVDSDGKEHSSKGPKASTKTKDLSHVPCRFYKAGACTAGASCPFSHTAAEPGQPKGICQWYIKGNCKFAHKCALAHVLPGQPMSMDRKNKRAEQQAAKNAAASGQTANTPIAQSTPTKDREGGDGKRNSSQEHRENSSSKSGTGPALSSTPATAPGRPSSLSISSRPPMTIGKAAPTVSTIASDPSMHDSDFHQSSGDSIPRRGSGVATSFAAAVAAGISPNQSGLSALRPSSLLTNTNVQGSGLAAAMAANGRDSPLTPATGVPVSSVSPDIPNTEPEDERSPIPQSRPVHRPNLSSDLGFGPIGSPPTASRLGTSPGRSPQSGGIALARARLPNGLSPPVSSPPLAGFDLDSSETNTIGSPPPPSSVQPATSSLFAPYGQGGSVPARMTSLSQLQPMSSAAEPHNTSSGAGGQAAAQRPSAWAGSLPATTFLGDSMNSATAEEGDLEDFLPSSLNELLTPGERSRRMSKSNISRPRFNPDSASAGSGAGVGIAPQQQRENVHAPQPRFVSSVPTASLLNNFRGIWDDSSQTNDVSSGGQQPSGGVEPWTRNNGRLSAGISGSLGGVDVPSPSLLGTSNASAAFLPGRMNRTATGGLSQHNREPLSMGGASSSFDPRTSASRFNPASDLALSPPRFNGGLGLPSSQSNNAGGFGASGIFMSGQNDTSFYGMHDASSNSRQPHSPAAHLANQYMTLSPTSARALRAHEPGQSLPQGLAAGLSRLHLVPATNPISPSAVSASPSASISMSVASNGGGFATQQNAYGNWLKSTSGEMSPPPVGLGTGVASPPRFATHGGLGTTTSNANPASYSMLSRGTPSAAGGRRDVSWTSQAQASPLSRPTVPDDDTMFDMDT